MIFAFNKTTEITMSIAREAATAMPSPDELNKAIEEKDVTDRKSLAAVA